MNWLAEQVGFSSVAGVGHRVVHGMNHTQPELITPELLGELRRISPYAPEHLPGEIELIEAFLQRRPKPPQVACFDTAFHRTMPRVAKLLPIPRRYAAQGVERYGFHGLSYSYLMDELARLGDPAATIGRVILAHLGNGASLAAVRDGKSIDTSMGFTPTAGVPMSTRSGDLDPGLIGYLARTEQMTATQFNEMANSQSGLLGISETSSDMRDLLERESQDVRAAEAIALFCYEIKKRIGAFAAASADWTRSCSRAVLERTRRCPRPDLRGAAISWNRTRRATKYDECGCYFLGHPRSYGPCDPHRRRIDDRAIGLPRPGTRWSGTNVSRD